jgi:hypothetical protein
MLTEPAPGLDEFFFEEPLIEADFLEHLFAELHHLPSLVHHHGSALARLKVQHPQAATTDIGRTVIHDPDRCRFPRSGIPAQRDQCWNPRSSAWITS